jgi:hypothetical protein
MLPTKRGKLSSHQYQVIRRHSDALTGQVAVVRIPRGTGGFKGHRVHNRVKVERKTPTERLRFDKKRGVIVSGRTEYGVKIHRVISGKIPPIDQIPKSKAGEGKVYVYRIGRQRYTSRDEVIKKIQEYGKKKFKKDPIQAWQLLEWEEHEVDFPEYDMESGDE